MEDKAWFQKCISQFKKQMASSQNKKQTKLKH